MAKKILVIDDDPDISSLTKAFLENKGYIALTAKDGKEGVTIANKQTPDLILLDILMPNMDGFAVLQEIKKSQKN